MITPYKGKFHVEWYKKIASHAFAMNDLCLFHSTGGFLHPYVDGGIYQVAGLCLQTVAATDADYASNTLIPVLVGDDNAEYLCDCAATATQAQVGLYCDVDDAATLDTDASSYDIFLITKLINTTKVVAKIAVKGGAAVTTTYSA